MEENKEHKKEISKKDVEGLVVETLKTIFDPEIPVDVYELGLIYEINIDDVRDWLELRGINPLIEEE